MSTDPIVKTVRVNLSPEAAFDLFTSRMSAWWPLGKNSVSAGEGETAKSLDLEPKVNGELVEIGHDGTRHVWGHVQVWEPGRSVAMSWHPGQSPENPTRVQVDFQPDGDGTRVTLVHSGWEALGEEGPKARGSYNEGWNGVLAAYSAAG